jgi:hypothetical protein
VNGIAPDGDGTLHATECTQVDRLPYDSGRIPENPPGNSAGFFAYLDLAADVFVTKFAVGEGRSRKPVHRVPQMPSQPLERVGRMIRVNAPGPRHER